MRKSYKAKNTTYIHNNQKFYDISTYIFDNRDMSYEELQERLKKYDINSINELYLFFLLVDCSYNNVIDKIKIIIKHIKNKNDNIYDSELEEEYNKIGKVEFEIFNNYKNNKSNSKIPLFFYHETKEDPNYEKWEKIALMLMSNISYEDIYKKHNISESYFNSHLKKYLSRSPEIYAKYIIYKYKIMTYDLEKVKEIKEKIKFYLSNIEKNIMNLNDYVKDNREYNNYLAKLNKYKNMYNLALSCFKMEERALPNLLKGADQDIIELCKNISNIMLYEEHLKSPYMTDDNYKIALEIYKKELKLINKIN